MAHEDDRIYGDILSAVTGIVFFGTPHRGSKGADMGKVVARAVNMCLRASQTAGFAGLIRDDLLKDLGINSQTLTDIAISSRNRLMNKDVVSFYETKTISGLTDLVGLTKICSSLRLTCLELRLSIKALPYWKFRAKM